MASNVVSFIEDTISPVRGIVWTRTTDVPATAAKKFRRNMNQDSVIRAQNKIKEMWPENASNVTEVKIGQQMDVDEEPPINYISVRVRVGGTEIDQWFRRNDPGPPKKISDRWMEYEPDDQTDLLNALVQRAAEHEDAFQTLRKLVLANDDARMRFLDLPETPGIARLVVSIINETRSDVWIGKFKELAPNIRNTST